jgi:chromosome segregation ATPase
LTKEFSTLQEESTFTVEQLKTDLRDLNRKYSLSQLENANLTHHHSELQKGFEQELDTLQQKLAKTKQNNDKLQREREKMTQDHQIERDRLESKYQKQIMNLEKQLEEVTDHQVLVIAQAVAQAKSKMKKQAEDTLALK